MGNKTISNVSDTALWMAAYRAQESERADAVFKDRLAKKLAGERGIRMVAGMPHSKAMAFAIVVRTVAIDELVSSAIAKGVDTVINLGAGLDTRPYRMELPFHLRWIEVDLELLISYKSEALAAEEPVCRLQRISANLADEEGRGRLLRKLGEETGNALVITEGVIGYLTNDQVARLSLDLFAVPAFHYWILDYSQGKHRKNRHSDDVAHKLRDTAPWKFSMADPIGFFRSQGWKMTENTYILDQADRLGRPLPLIFPWSLLMRLFPKKIRDMGNRTFGYAMLGKSH